MTAPARVFTFPSPGADDADAAALRTEGYVPIQVDGVTLAGVTEPELERALAHALADVRDPAAAEATRATALGDLAALDAALDAALGGGAVEADAPAAVIRLLAAGLVRFGITEADALPFVRVTWTRAPDPVPQVLSDAVPIPATREEPAP